MTKTSIYCYEKNGGTCRNKVSSANNFICGAGHGKREETASNLWDIPKITSVEDISKVNIGQMERLASDLSTSPKLLDQLAKVRDEYVREALSKNRSTSLEAFTYLANLGYFPYGFVADKTIDELIKDISLVDQYPDTFGLAYLYRLLDKPILKDRSHIKRRALIGYVYEKYAEDDEADDQYKQYYKDKIKALFPDDQEIAEIVGY